jgi:hypothetical protein
MKICLQAGHKNITSGAVGAPGERDWNSKIVPMIAERLRNKGIDVYETDALGYNDTTVVEIDWDLFLSVHYDADVYNDTGGFVDFPEPSTDGATNESQRIAKVLSDYYFAKTGIKNVNRSNANTRYYYMWQYLSKDTPCNLIECGVGWRKPEDYETLRNYDLIADAISGGILKAFGFDSFLDEDIPSEVEEAHLLKEQDRYNKYWTYNELIEDWVKLSKEVIYEKTEKDKYKKEARELREVVESQAEEIQNCKKEVESLSKANATQYAEIQSLQAQFADVSRERDSLIDIVEGYKSSLSKCKAEVKDLQAKLTAKDPLDAYSAKELWAALFDKVFKRG